MKSQLFSRLYREQPRMSVLFAAENVSIRSAQGINASMLAGLCVGLLLSLTVTCGMLYAWGYFADAETRRLQEELHAVATHGADSMALATGQIDEGVEGLFVLDFITGELTCQVLNPRTGTLGGMFRQNVVVDLGVEQGKLTKYLLVTGGIETRQNVSNVRPAKSIAYVVDSNTGKYVAYMLPWNQQVANSGGQQANPMIVIGKGSARNAPVE